ncbi:MAG: hypothetical protein RLZZ66_1306 [Pseudomonadota bacterium]
MLKLRYFQFLGAAILLNSCAFDTTSPTLSSINTPEPVNKDQPLAPIEQTISPNIPSNTNPQVIEVTPNYDKKEPLLPKEIELKPKKVIEKKTDNAKKKVDSTVANKNLKSSEMNVGNDQKLLNELVAQDKDEQSNFSDILSNLINDKTLHPKKLYDVLENLLNTTTKNQPEIYLAQAKILINQKDYSASEIKIKNALDIKPEWADALFVEANLAFLENDYDRAKRLLTNENLSNAFAEKVFYKELLAQTFIKTMDFVQAEPIYEWLINQASPKNEYYMALALTQLKLNKEDSAKKILQMFTEKEKTVWQSAANFYLAQIEEKNQNFSKAITLYDKVVEGELTFEAGIASVNLLISSEKYGLADEHLQVLLSNFPMHRSRLALMRASLFNLQNQPEKSIKILTDSIEKLPDDKHLLYAKALLAKRLKRFDEMESSLKKILAKSPNDIDALNMLGYRLLEESQRYAEAEKYLQKAKELSHNDPAILDSFGWLQFKKGNIQSALTYLQMAYEKTENSDIAVHLSQIMWILDKQEESKKILQLALKKTPENAELLSIQKKLLDR